MDEDLKIFISTIYGEAACSSVAAQRAIASVIMNRIDRLEWAKYDTAREIIAHTGFDAYTQENIPFKAAFRALGQGFKPNAETPLAHLYSAVLPIYLQQEPPTTDAVLYYSPRAQSFLHNQKPGLYPERPRWDFSKIILVNVPGTENDDFAFYTYKTKANIA